MTDLSRRGDGYLHRGNCSLTPGVGIEGCQMGKHTIARSKEHCSGFKSAVFVADLMEKWRSYGVTKLGISVRRCGDGSRLRPNYKEVVLGRSRR